MYENKLYAGSMKDRLFDGLLESIKHHFNENETPAYISFQTDPVGFGEQVLDETYTKDVKTLMESVRDNPVTIAKSANATGVAADLKRIGYAPKVSDVNNKPGQKRVWIGPYASKQEAQKVSKQLAGKRGDGGYVKEYPF